MRLKMKSDVALVALKPGRYAGRAFTTGEKFIVRASDVKAVKALGWGTEYIGDEPPQIWEEPTKELEMTRKDEPNRAASQSGVEVPNRPVASNTAQKDETPESYTEHVDLPVEEEKEEAPAKPKRTYKRRDLVAE